MYLVCTIAHPPYIPFLFIAFPVWVLATNPGLSQLTLSSNWWQCECEFVRKFRTFIDDNIEAIPDANNIKCTSSELGGGLGKGQQCTELMSSNFHNQVLGENLVPVLIGIVILSLALIIALGAIYRLRDTFRIWLHAKYGYRLCFRNKRSETNLNLSVASQGSSVLFEAVVLYSQKDNHAVVNHIANQLEPEYRLYLHHRDLAGIYNSEAFKSALTASLAHVVVLSQAFLATEWEQVKELVLSNCIVIICEDITRQDILSNPDLHAFIKSVKHSLNWNDAAFWRKLRYYLPDPIQSNKRLVQASKILAKEAGAELDVSGVWTFTPNNESGLSTTQLLPQTPDCPSIPLNNPNSGSTTMLAMLRANNAAVAPNFPAPPVRKQPRPYLDQIYHQRSRSQDAEMTLNDVTPMTRSCGTNVVHQRSVSAVAATKARQNPTYLNNDVHLMSGGGPYRQYQSQILRDHSPVQNSHLRSASHVLPGTRQSPIGAAAAAGCGGGSFIHQLAISSPDPDLLHTLERHQRQEQPSPQRPKMTSHLYAKHGRSTSTVVPMTTSSQSPIRPHAATQQAVHQRSKSHVVESNPSPVVLNAKQLSRQAVKQYKSTTNLSGGGGGGHPISRANARSTSNLSTVHQRSSSSPYEGFVL